VVYLVMASILVVAERYWPDGGGAELATHLIVGILSREFEVTVITGTRNPQRFPRVNYVYESLLSIWEKPLLWLNTIKLAGTERFKKLVKESDIVYVPRFAFPIIPFAKKLNKKVVVHLHDYIPISYTAVVLAPYEEHKHRIVQDDVFLECMKGFKYCLGVSLFWWLPKLARKWILQADKIICVSKRQAEIVTDQIPELRDRIEVVYNPLPPKIVNNEPRKELDDTPTFLYVGGDSYIKGFHILLQALKELGKQGIKARFILTNRYSLRNLEILKRLSGKYRNLEIQVVGRVSYEKLLEIHKKAWALLFPSIYEETFGYAVLEASLSATIPIASRVGAIPELLSSTIASRYLSSPNNYIELVEKIAEICHLGADEVMTIGETLRRSMLEKFSLNNIERNIIEVFSG